MSEKSNGGDLFIVDNSNSGWTGLRYLEEWCDISDSFDIATGYFEIGSLLALDPNWQALKKIRILMGSETTRRTIELLQSVKNNALSVLDQSLELTKEPNPFLNGVPAILSAMETGQIECRVYDKSKFHAKTYITHAQKEVIGSKALVGSSNFTNPGLTQNIELNIQVQSAREVAQLQEWFEDHWAEGKEVSDAVMQIIERHTRHYSPFDVYAKALQEFFKGHALTSNEWDETESKMFPQLDRYQQEAYWSLMKIANQHDGAFLCDGVGLGKTFVGLMLIERLVIHEGKRVVLFAPKATKDGVWLPHLSRWLPQVGGAGGAADFSNLAVFSHTDFARKGDFPERFERISELADVVIIDEAHHFRNPGTMGNPEEDIEPSRYHKLFKLLHESTRPKKLFMLTATPINNRLTDFRHLAELFTKKDEQYFAKTLGVNNLTSHFSKMERALQKAVGHDVTDTSEYMKEAQALLEADEVIKELVVQRSRSYVRASQEKEKGKLAIFPVRDKPRVAVYSIFKTYGNLLSMFEKAFAKKNPLFTLPMYYPLQWYTGDDEEIGTFDRVRQEALIGLIRTTFLKRFESSVISFETSCNRLLQKIIAFIEVHEETDKGKERLEDWKKVNADILGYVTNRQYEMFGEEDEEEVEEDIVPPEILAHMEKKKFSGEEYELEKMIDVSYEDLDQIIKFLVELKKFNPSNDDKCNKLKRLLKSKELEGEKVLIFTEYADTARYLKNQLNEAGIDGVDQVDSATKVNRAKVIRRFSPYYNESSPGELKDDSEEEIRILISTDVLSEGLNLQDATKMINYDIHWNPVRLMQRIGRVDRRMNPEIEKRIIKENPEREKTRGKVSFWNFLPPDELNKILTLFKRVTNKTLLISETLGIEGKRLLTPNEEYNAIKEFNHQYEGDRTTEEDMHLEFQDLIEADPELEGRLRSFPGSVFSGRKKPAKGIIGVFFCYALPAFDKDKEEFTEEAGTTKWYLQKLDSDESPLDDPSEIVNYIKSKPSTPRKCTTEEQTLIDIRKKVEKHIKNTHLKRIEAPVGVEPALKCWMELNEG
jgi:HKD family nuclease